MKNVFGKDEKRIKHAFAVLGYSKKIHQSEDGDNFVITAAAILHDIGIHEAEKKYASPAGRYQEIEGPPIARRILKKYNVDEQEIEHICKIIANHHSARDIDTIEFRIIWDSDWLVNLAEEADHRGKNELAEMINKRFKTTCGKQLALGIYTKE
ncbi:MAG: hypothetical protein A2173_08060 [Planctomycetes bacterium RBG_13_44_8b]|nr:MAG: hypothetical protein A2173_08060 [Planctomycetes bacterium RBG_13_44_8b]